MRKVVIYLLIAFIWLSGFLTAKCFASTLVRADGEIVERTYKPSYLVENNVTLADIEDSQVVKARHPRQVKWIVTSYPGSTIKTKRRPNNSITIMGEPA